MDTFGLYWAQDSPPEPHRMESGPKLHITECVDTVCACVAAIIATLPNQENFIFDHLNFKKIFQVYYIFVNTQELLLC